MKIAIAGGSGFLGTALMKKYPDYGWMPLSRQQLYSDEEVLSAALEGADAVINLAGSTIARWWTRAAKRKILLSRNAVNENLVRSVNRMNRKPDFFLTASGINIYAPGDSHTEKEFREGSGFLAEVVRRWEKPLEGLDPSVSPVCARFGIVLGLEGGALVPLLRAARWKVLPVIGDGKQGFSQVHVDDLVEAVMFLVKRKASGIYNVTAPRPADNGTFTRYLARKGGAWLTPRVPVWVMRLAMGEAHVILTEGSRVLPERLLEEGFEFRYPTVESALDQLVKAH